MENRAGFRVFRGWKRKFKNQDQSDAELLGSAVRESEKDVFFESFHGLVPGG